MHFCPDILHHLQAILELNLKHLKPIWAIISTVLLLQLSSHWQQIQNKIYILPVKNIQQLIKSIN